MVKCSTNLYVPKISVINKVSTLVIRKLLDAETLMKFEIGLYLYDIDHRIKNQKAYWCCDCKKISKCYVTSPFCNYCNMSVLMVSKLLKYIKFKKADSSQNKNSSKYEKLKTAYKNLMILLKNQFERCTDCKKYINKGIIHRRDYCKCYI